MPEPKIYFCGSIRGGRDDAALYQDLIEQLETHGTILSEHVAKDDVEEEEKQLDEEEIYQRDRDWLNDADMVVAEVTTPSLGVGYELAIAEKLELPTLCLYRTDGDHALSAMVRGCSWFDIVDYDSLDDAVATAESFITDNI